MRVVDAFLRFVAASMTIDPPRRPRNKGLARYRTKVSMHKPAGTKLAREAASGMCTLRFGRPGGTRKLG